MGDWDDDWPDSGLDRIDRLLMGVVVVVAMASAVVAVLVR